MEPGYRIIPARPEHLPSLGRIETAAASIFPVEYLAPSLGVETLTRRVLESALRQERLWVAVDSSGAPVGFALADEVDGDAHLVEIDVAPEHGRRGLGRRLVETVAAWGRDRGLRALTLTTFRELAWNEPFYERLGFRALASQALTPGLASLLDAEARSGLDPDKRVAMRRELGGASET